MRRIICIGICAYDGLDDQVSQDYMRLMYHLGRRHPEYDFQLAIKGKSEQFRARNAIVTSALQMGADYLLMLDDDHIFDLEDRAHTSEDLSFKGYSGYDIPIKLAKHLEDNPDIGVVGALYWQRGGACYPLIMQEKDGVPYFLHHSEVSYKMQKVDITGGGCMMINMKVFDRIEDPWFVPEHEFGTDIQLCKQVRAAGYEVWCDTSLEIGHLQKEKTIVSSKNIKEMWDNSGMDKSWKFNDALASYRADAEKYLGKSIKEMGDLANEYSMESVDKYTDLKEYYAKKGKEQLARQVLFHHTFGMVQQMEHFHALINTNHDSYGCDIGCGSAPVTFEFALKGHKFDFIDIDGAGAYEFLKWRVKEHNLDCGFELKGPYDYVFMLDSIEHIEDWKGMLNNMDSHLKDGGALITNYFLNEDYDNPEHISMDKDAVQKHLISLGYSPINEVLWQKKAERKTA